MEKLTGDSTDMPEVDTAKHMTLAFAEGNVDPSVRAEAGEIKMSKVHELAERLAGDEFYDDVDPESVPCKCMDCRLRADGRETVEACAAGGTLSTVVGDALTHNSYRESGEKFATHVKKVFGELKRKGKKVGGHDDDMAQAPSAGCGAGDKLDSPDPGQPSILRFIRRKGEVLRDTLTSLGLQVSDGQHDMVIGNTESLIKEGYASPGVEVRDAMQEAAGEEAVETLANVQRGVVVVVNTQQGKSLNRQKVADEYGEDYQVFNIDAWSIKNGAEATSASAEEADDKYVAGLYYNLAAGGVIAGPSMIVVVR